MHGLGWLNLVGFVSEALLALVRLLQSQFAKGRLTCGILLCALYVWYITMNYYYYYYYSYGWLIVLCTILLQLLLLGVSYFILPICGHLAAVLLANLLQHIHMQQLCNDGL